MGLKLLVRTAVDALGRLRVKTHVDCNVANTAADLEARGVDLNSPEANEALNAAERTGSSHQAWAGVGEGKLDPKKGRRIRSVQGGVLLV